MENIILPNGIPRDTAVPISSAAAGSDEAGAGTLPPRRNHKPAALSILVPESL
jgi:hypothetical protein